MASEAMMQAVAVTAELTGTELSVPAARVLCEDLSRYPEQQVLGALLRCRRELRSRLTLADVIARLDDGRPGPDEAWAAIPRDEDETVVMTDEIATALGVCRPLLDAGDSIAARMAFLEAYRREIASARDQAKPVRWFPALGHDKAGREGPILAAVEVGRLTRGHAMRCLPDGTTEKFPALARSGEMRRLESPTVPREGGKSGAGEAQDGKATAQDGGR